MNILNLPFKIARLGGLSSGDDHVPSYHLEFRPDDAWRHDSVHN